jgi:hypothetical protein
MKIRTRLLSRLAPLGYDRPVTRRRTKRTRTRKIAPIMAKSMTREHKRSDKDIRAIEALLAFDTELQIAINLFKEYQQVAPDSESKAIYADGISRLIALTSEVNRLVNRYENKGKRPHLSKIAELHAKLRGVFDDYEYAGVEYTNIEEAKSEKRFNVRNMRNALLNL